MKLVARILITALAIGLSALILGSHMDIVSNDTTLGTILATVLVAVIYGLVHMVVKPIVQPSRCRSTSSRSAWCRS